MKSGVRGVSRKSRARSKPFSLLNHEFSCRGKGDILLFTEMDFLYGAFYLFFNVNTLCKKNKSQIIQKRREKEEKRPLTADRHCRQTDTESQAGDSSRMRATRTPGFRFTKTRSCYAFNRRCFLLPSPCSEDMFLRKTCDSATSLVIAFNGMTVFQHASTVPR